MVVLAAEEEARFGASRQREYVISLKLFFFFLDFFLVNALDLLGPRLTINQLWLVCCLFFLFFFFGLLRFRLIFHSFRCLGSLRLLLLLSLLLLVLLRLFFVQNDGLSVLVELHKMRV